MTSVLMVLSRAKVWTMKDGTPHPTGFWSEEFVTPHQKFTAAGFEIHIATSGGLTPTVNPLSFALGYNNNDQGKVDAQKAYLKELEGVLSTPLNLAAMLDSPSKIVAAVCHGPASFLSAHRADGTWLFKGRQLTGFSNVEETQASFAGNAPLVAGRSPAPGGRQLRRQTGLDSPCRRRWQPHHRSAELLGRRDCRCSAKETQRDGLNEGAGEPGTPGSTTRERNGRRTSLRQMSQ